MAKRYCGAHLHHRSAKLAIVARHSEQQLFKNLYNRTRSYCAFLSQAASRYLILSPSVPPPFLFSLKVFHKDIFSKDFLQNNFPLSTSSKMYDTFLFFAFIGALLAWLFIESEIPITLASTMDKANPRLPPGSFSSPVTPSGSPAPGTSPSSRLPRRIRRQLSRSAKLASPDMPPPSAPPLPPVFLSPSVAAFAVNTPVVRINDKDDTVLDVQREEQFGCMERVLDPILGWKWKALAPSVLEERRKQRELDDRVEAFLADVGACVGAGTDDSPDSSSRPGLVPAVSVHAPVPSRRLAPPPSPVVLSKDTRTVAEMLACIPRPPFPLAAYRVSEPPAYEKLSTSYAGVPLTPYARGQVSTVGLLAGDSTPSMASSWIPASFPSLPDVAPMAAGQSTVGVPMPIPLPSSVPAVMSNEERLRLAKEKARAMVLANQAKKMNAPLPPQSLLAVAPVAAGQPTVGVPTSLPSAPAGPVAPVFSAIPAVAPVAASQPTVPSVLPPAPAGPVADFFFASSGTAGPSQTSRNSRGRITRPTTTTTTSGAKRRVAPSANDGSTDSKLVSQLAPSMISMEKLDTRWLTTSLTLTVPELFDYHLDEDLTISSYTPGWPLKEFGVVLLRKSEFFREVVNHVRWQFQSGRSQPAGGSRALVGLINCMEGANRVVEGFLQYEKVGQKGWDETTEQRFRGWARALRYAKKYWMEEYADKIGQQLDATQVARLNAAMSKSEQYFGPKL